MKKKSTYFVAIVVALTASILLVSSASAATPRYDENGNLCGYDYSIDEINMDKLRDIIANGSKEGDTSVDIGIYINDEVVSVNNIEHDFNISYDTDGISRVQLRPVAEAVGYKVVWNSHNQTVILSNDNNEIMLEIGSATAVKNGVSVALNAAAQIIDDSTYLSVTDISYLLN